MDVDLRAAIRERAQGRCEYCRLPDSVEHYGVFHLEHVIAKQHGGQSEFENLAWSCCRCNFLKGPNLASIDPDSVAIVRLFNPRIDGWNDHFDLRHGMIVGRTAIGRATVRLLEMNAAERMCVRLELVANGEFNLED